MFVCQKYRFLHNNSYIQLRYLSNEVKKKGNDVEDFRVLNFRDIRSQSNRNEKFKKREVSLPRSFKMHVDQQWTSVWSYPKSFQPATVPLPIRQGYKLKSASHPGKFYNAELMKIPNFLHLTPPTIKKQCELLRKFCTPWPQKLNSKNIGKYFPIRIVTADICQALPTIRNTMNCAVTIKLNISMLELDKCAKDKFFRLVGEKYDNATGDLAIIAKRCPLKKQNYDYAHYLLAAVYHESWQREDWEKTKSEVDFESYRFEKYRSRIAVENILNWGKTKSSQLSEMKSTFKSNIENLFNNEKSMNYLQEYKQGVLELLSVVAYKNVR